MLIPFNIVDEILFKREIGGSRCDECHICLVRVEITKCIYALENKNLGRDCNN